MYFVKILLLVVVLFANLSANAFADDGKLAVKSSHQAGQIVKAQYGGKVLKVSQSGKSAYAVKILNADGKIFTVRVDAKTGKVFR